MFLAEAALETTWWALKRTYDVGYYMMYGYQETKEDRILKQIEELKHQQEEELRLMREYNEKNMKNNIYELYSQLVLDKKQEEQILKEST